MAVHQHTRSFNRGLGESRNVESLTIEGGGEVEQISIPNAADQLLSLAIDISQVTSLFILAAAAMTLETNSSSAATDTISLKAGIPYVWTSPGSYDTCKITADVTKIYLTNASGAAANFELSYGYGDQIV